MRHNSEELLELISTIECNSNYFGTVAITLKGETRHIKFWLTPKGYRALRRILQMRPFETTPGVLYRYFFLGCSRFLSGSITAQIRIEQGNNAKTFSFEVPETLAANLEWFCKLSDFQDASHLHCVEPKT